MMSKEWGETSSSQQRGMEGDSQATGNNSSKKILGKTPWLCVIGKKEEKGTTGVPKADC